MRQIGTFQERSAAHRFAAFLVTQGINAHTEQRENSWSIWVREEDQLGKAKTALAEFMADPGNPRYQDVERTAVTRAREENAKREAAKQNVVEMRNRWGTRRPARRRPLTIAVVFLCSAVFIASDVGRSPTNTVFRTLMFSDPIHLTQGWRGESVEEKLIDVRRGQAWRLFTPAFLHADVLHLAFNMVMFYQLAGAIEHRRGTWRLGLMILLIAVVSNLFQALVPNEWGGGTNFLGLSGVVYGLFGYLWMKSSYQPELGLYIDRGTIVLLVAYLLLGFAGVLNRGGYSIANWAHGIGCLSGIVIGIIPVWLKPRPTK